jgi:transcriptional regulator with XRE-family HTH domain
MNSIRAKRKTFKMSQTELAEKLNVDQTAISKWETGEAMPRADKLPELAKTLGCTIDDLFKTETRQ